METTVVKELGLRIKLHVLNCGEHNENIVEVEKIITKPIAHSSSNIDNVPGNPKTIYKHLKTSKYIPYSCILIFVNCINCNCNEILLDEVLSVMRKNIYLRYKSKLLLTTYYVKCLNGLKISSQLENLDNTLLFQYIVWAEPDEKSFDFICNIGLNPIKSIREFLFEQGKRGSSYYLGRTFSATTTADLYFYNINPALAIIINNYYFTSPFTNREGSEYDVWHLMQKLNAAGIPFILEQDCTKKEMLEILDYLKKENFNPVKSFLFFMMSHGSENNIIHTTDGQLNIQQDIIDSIQSNKTLRNAKKLYVFNACRGPIHLDYGDDDDIEQINEMPPTVLRNLDENTVVLYSVTELVKSPRCPDSGCPFMQNFIRELTKLIILQNDIQNSYKELEQNLKKLDYFYCLDKCSELVVKDPKKSYKIIQISRGSLEMLHLIENILNNFKTLRKRRDNHADEAVKDQKLGVTFYICGSLNKANLPVRLKNLLPLQYEEFLEGDIEDIS